MYGGTEWNGRCAIETDEQLDLARESHGGGARPFDRGGAAASMAFDDEPPLLAHPGEVKNKSTEKKTKKGNRKNETKKRGGRERNEKTLVGGEHRTHQ